MVQKTVENDQGSEGSKLKHYAVKGAKWAALPPLSIFGFAGMVRRHQSIANIVRDAVTIPSRFPADQRKSFDGWVEDLGLTQADVANRESEILLESRICYLFTLLAMAVALTYVIDGNTYAVVCGMAGAWICAVSGWCRCFRVFQIRRREFCDLSVYVRSPEGWIA